jgi:hypothetical protein
MHQVALERDEGRAERRKQAHLIGVGHVAVGDCRFFNLLFLCVDISLSAI